MLEHRYIHIIYFSKVGGDLAKGLSSRIRDISPETAVDYQRSGKPLRASEWTKANFSAGHCLIFIGAAGIAVRSIAPLLRSKTADPAVLVMDEGGHFVIPILSGHLGGANETAEKIAEVTGATPVITTATDVRGRFAVDTWAKREGLQILEPERIVNVSAKILDGEGAPGITVTSRWEIRGSRPAGVATLPLADPFSADVVIDVLGDDEERALHLVPTVVYVGIGCRKGVPEERIEACWQMFLRESRLREQAVAGVASIDVKKEEAGLVKFCETHGFRFTVFSKDELNAVTGDFGGSDFVKKTVGTDSVCERSAVAASGGELLVRKFALDGVTMAAAVRDVELNW